MLMERHCNFLPLGFGIDQFDNHRVPPMPAYTLTKQWHTLEISNRLEQRGSPHLRTSLAANSNPLFYLNIKAPLGREASLRWDEVHSQETQQCPQPQPRADEMLRLVNKLMPKTLMKVGEKIKRVFFSLKPYIFISKWQLLKWVQYTGQKGNGFFGLFLFPFKR